MAAKKLLVLTAAGLTTIALAAFGIEPSTPTQAEDGSNQATMQASFDMGSTLINGIDVPFEVLMYAQLEYQGHAVTYAEKVTWNGQAAYRLRVDRDIYRDDYDSFYLYFDMGWNLLRDEKLQALPTPPPAPEPQPATPAPESETQTEPEPKPEPVERRPGPIGGEVRSQDNNETQESDNANDHTTNNGEVTDDNTDSDEALTDSDTSDDGDKIDNQS